ncbi:MAG: site-specific tyrosine recombinase/integron integrase [Nanoarchaeota archaeon]
MLDKLETELKIRGFSQKTIESYLLHNKQFIGFIKKEPMQVDENDIKKYMGYLMTEKNYKPRSISLMLSSLKFFYTNILNKNILDKIKTPKLDKKIPTVLSNDEVRNLLNSITNNKHKILISLMLSSGLRVSEAVSLKSSDLNFDEKTLYVRSGKGKKDRISIISSSLLDNIKQYLSERKDQNPYLFPIRDTHVTIKLAQKVIKQAARKANLNKRVYCHALRSTFATNLMNSGVNLRFIQTLLGHSSISTTEMYTKVTTDELRKIKNPLDGI